MTTTTYSRTERKTPYLGNAYDDFSRLMYSYRHSANKGFTFIDFDFLARNYEKKTFCIIEIKTYNSSVTYAQQRSFAEIDIFLKNGVCDGWHYLGFKKLIFERGGFSTGKAELDGVLISEKEFLDFLTDNF